MNRCPECGSFVANDDTECWSCNTPLSSEPVAPAEAPQPDEGADVPEQPLAEEPEYEPEPPEPETPEPVPPPSTYDDLPAPLDDEFEDDGAEPEEPITGRAGTKPPEEPIDEGMDDDDEGEVGEEDDFVDMDDSDGEALPQRYEPAPGGEDEYQEGPSDEPVKPRRRRRRTDAPRRKSRAEAPPPPRTPERYRPRRPYSEGQILPSGPPSKWKNYSTGSYIILVGVVFLLLAIMLPWYHIDYSAELPEGTSNEVYRNSTGITNGSKVRVVEINGHDPVKINIAPFTGADPEEQEDPLANYLPFPLGLVWGSLLIISTIYRFWKNKPMRRGKKYMTSGIFLMILIIVIFVIIMKAHTAIPGAPGEMLSAMETSPLGGSDSIVIEDWEEAGIKPEVSVFWGADTGLFLLMGGAGCYLVGGITEYRYGKRMNRELEEAYRMYRKGPYRDPREAQTEGKFGRSKKRKGKKDRSRR